MIAEAVTTAVIIAAAAAQQQQEVAPVQSGEFDVAIVSNITADELYSYAPAWCSLSDCERIVELSREYGIASEFALTVFRYEYVAGRNSVGGWENDAGEYVVYDSVQDSIEKWFENMSVTYMDERSNHYQITGGTRVYDIAPLYNQGSVQYNENSMRWYKTINFEALAIANGEELW